MKLPVSFEEVSYFNNEYRGDLIITEGVVYYFPHTRVVTARYSEEIGGKDGLVIFDLLGNLAPVLGTVPWIHAIAGKSIKIGRFFKRTFRPTRNSPQIRKQQLWTGNESNESLQKRLDEYIARVKRESFDFADDAVPKPMRFAIGEIENVSFGLKFKFDAKFDNHDFRVNLLHRRHLREALKAAGLLN